MAKEVEYQQGPKDKGESEVINAVRKQYPQLTDPEVEKLAKTLIEQIADTIRSGGDLAFIKESEEEVQIKVLHLEIIKKK